MNELPNARCTRKVFTSYLIDLYILNLYTVHTFTVVVILSESNLRKRGRGMLSEINSERGGGLHSKCNSVENQLKCLVNCTQTYRYIYVCV